MMKWYAIKLGTSYSNEIVDYALKSEKDEKLYLVEEEYNFSEHFRGVVAEKIEAPPQEWIENEIRRNEKGIEYRKKEIKELKKLNKKYQKCLMQERVWNEELEEVSCEEQWDG